MELTNSRATFGLNTQASPSSSNVTGSVKIGPANQSIAYPDADVAYSVRAIFAGSGEMLSIDLSDNDTTGSDTFVAGAAQVETATAVGTITLAGNAEVVVTATGMAGTPKTILVPVALDDTATVWAGKVRAALADDAAVSAMFDVGGLIANIRLTRKPSASFNVPGGVLNLFHANIANLNIALDNGTCTGITTAGTSADTTAGVISEGVKIYDDATDFEGNALPVAAKINAIQFDVGDPPDGNMVITDTANTITAGPSESLIMARRTGSVGLGDGITATADGGIADLTITVIGTTA